MISILSQLYLKLNTKCTIRKIYHKIGINEWLRLGSGYDKT